MSTKEKLDAACAELRRAIKNETQAERCARLWRAAIASGSIQTRTARALQNKGGYHA